MESCSVIFILVLPSADAAAHVTAFSFISLAVTVDRASRCSPESLTLRLYLFPECGYPFKIETLLKLFSIYTSSYNFLSSLIYINYFYILLTNDELYLFVVLTPSQWRV